MLFLSNLSFEAKKVVGGVSGCFGVGVGLSMNLVKSLGLNNCPTRT